MDKGQVTTAQTSVEEYLARFDANQKIEGFGLNVGMRVPCPFCAAPDFFIYKVIEVEEIMSKGATCSECNRSAAAVIQKAGGSTTIEVVQTGGPDQPDWLTPKMRRAQ